MKFSSLRRTAARRLTSSSSLTALAMAMLTGAVANAGAPDRFLWQDKNGLVEATGKQSCTPANASDIRLRVLQHGDGASGTGEIFTLPIGEAKFALPDRSLVLLANTAASVTANSIPARSGSRLIEVLSLPPSSTSSKLVRLNLAPVGKQGFVPEDSLHDIIDFVFEASKNSPVLTIGKSAVKIQDTFWQVALESERYATVACGAGEQKNTYILFNVFVPENTDPIAQVGISTEQSSLLRSFLARTPDEAETLADQRVKANPLNVEQASQRLRSTGPTAKIRNPLKRRSLVFDASEKPPVRSAAPVATAAPTIPLPVERPAEFSAKPSTSEAGATKKKSETTVPVFHGAFQFIVCTASSNVNIYSDDLQKVLFTVKSLESVKPVQSFDDANDKQLETSGGQTRTMVRIQVEDADGNTRSGWIDERVLQTKESCQFGPAKKKKDSAHDGSKLANGACCDFPTLGRPLRSYKEGGRRFRAERSDGRRLHAACDLYRPAGERVISVAPGTVIRSKYYFYQGVYAVEVRHQGGFIVRYGEVLGKNAKGISQGEDVTTGQTIGYVGTVNSGCCSPMLHFELYSGVGRGGLTQRGTNHFERRSDLLDPTSYLTRWEKNKFGESF